MRLGNTLRILMGCCTLLFLEGCSDRNEPVSSPPIAPAGNCSISGTIYWAAGNQVDGDVNDTMSTVVPQPNYDFYHAHALTSPAVVGGYVNVPRQGAPGRSYQNGDPSDFYSVTLHAGDIVRLVLPDEIDTDASRVQLLLYAQNQTQLDSMSLTNGQNDRVSVDEDGVYYIEIRAASGGTNYRLILGPAFQSSGVGAASEFVPGEVLVKFKSAAVGSTAQARTILAQRMGMRSAGGGGRWMRMRANDMAAAFKGLKIQGAPHSTGRLKGTALRQAQRRDTLRLVATMGRHADVAYAQPNYIRSASAFEPDDPLFEYQWHYSMIHLPEAWGLTEVWGVGEPPGSASVIVAVIDSGILSDHQDLAAKLVAGYDFVSDPTNAGDRDGIDDDPEDPGINSGYHGTHVAGTIAAAFNNGEGVAGVGGATRIMPVRVLGRDGGTDDDIANAIRWAAGLDITDGNGVVLVEGATPPADIINMSLGGVDDSKILYDAVVAAREAGVILIAAAGNESTNIKNYPAAYAEVVSVGAVAADAQPAFYSNYGTHIDIVAPGGDMYTDVQPDGYVDGILSTLGDEAGGDPIYGFAQGTSMAAPHVAGVAALMKAVQPTMTPSIFDNYIAAGDITIAADLGEVGKDAFYGYGLIDALQAVAAADGSPSSPVISVSPAAMHLDAFTTTAQLFLRQIGSDPLTLDIPSSDADWLTVSPSSGTVDFGQYALSVNRGNLAGGVHTATITYSSSANDVAIPVTIDVLPDTTAAAPTQYLLLVRASNLSTVVARQIITPVNGAYHFSFSGLSQGRYYLVCGSDLDNDMEVADQGEAMGYYPPLDGDPLDLKSDHNDLVFITGFSQNAFPLAGQVVLPLEGLSKESGHAQ